MLFAMWTLVLIALSWHEADAGEPARSPRDEATRGAIFGAVSALATLTRPEGVVLAGLIGLSMIVVRPQGSWRRFFVWAIGAAATFFIVLTPYLILNLRLTGGLLPDTAAAKQAEAADFLAQNYLIRLKDMLIPLFAGALVFLIPGMVYVLVVTLGRVRSERARLFDLLPLIWAGALVALYAARLPASYQHGRYVMPALPSLILPGMVGTIALIRWGRTSLVRRVLTRSLAIATVLAFIIFALVIGANQYAQDVSIVDQEMVTAAHWIADHIPANELLAVHDIGAVGYFAPRPILDLAGLVSPEIVPFIKDANRLWDWLQQRRARFLMAFPDQIPGGRVNDPRLCPVFTTDGAAAKAVGGPNMTIYELAWEGNCPKD
jgi:4-amino-4-deoxy-L-arabinose transferase-like glycosyltransferase